MPLARADHDGAVTAADLAAALATARAAWPGLEVAPALFEARVRACLPGIRQSLDQLPLGDLYLVAGCLAGLPAALAAFDERHLRPVPQLVRHLDARPDFADEVTQELRRKLLLAEPPALPRLASYSGRGPLAGFIAVAAQRAALDSLRRQGREIPVEAPALERLLSGAGNPELQLSKERLKANLQDALRAAIAALPVRDRLVLRLTLVSDLSLEQVGAIYQVNASTVSRWLARTRDRLLDSMRTFLEAGHGIDPDELASLVAFARSQVDVSLSGLLGT
jgi:RNA polymerase sigma-70 factor (ECF subfamily)